MLGFTNEVKPQVAAHSEKAIELIRRVQASESSLYTFIARVAKSKAVKEIMPKTHTFVASLHAYERTRGELTRQQKIAFNRTLQQNATMFVELMFVAPAPTAIAPAQSDEEIERAAMQSDDAPLANESGE